MQQVHSSRHILTFSQLMLVIYTHFCNVDCLLGIVVASMEHHYGINNNICTAWRKALRKMWHVYRL